MEILKQIDKLDVRNILYASMKLSGIIGSLPYLYKIVQNGAEKLSSTTQDEFQEWFLLNEGNMNTPNVLGRSVIFLSLLLEKIILRGHALTSVPLLFLLEKNSLDSLIDSIELICSYGDESDRVDRANLNIFKTFLKAKVAVIAANNNEADLMKVLEKFVQWSAKGYFKTPEIKTLLQPFSEKIDSMFQSWKNSWFSYELNEKIVDFKIEIIKLENKQSITDSDLTSFTTMFSNLRKELNAHSAEVNRWIQLNPSTFCSDVKKTIDEHLTLLTTQSTNGDSLFDRYQKIRNKVIANQSSVDLDDTVWNFLFMEVGMSLEDVYALTKTTTAQEVDAFFKKIKLPEVKNLISEGIVTREELDNKVVVRTKIENHIRSLNNTDIRSTVYSVLTKRGSLPTTLPNFIKTIDRVAAKAFYQIVLSFTIVAPILSEPTLAAFGLGIGLTYPILNALSLGSINAFLSIPKFDVYRDHMTMMTRRNLLATDAHSQEDVRKFVNADFFGRLRIFAFEAWTSWILTIMSIGQYPNTAYVGGFLQGALIGANIRERTSAAVYRQLSQRGFIRDLRTQVNRET